jgi:hypothetical protein
MRLENVEHGHKEAQKAVLAQIQARRGPDLPVPDVLRTMLYRPELFGAAYSDGLEEIMHGPSDWSVGERELFAAFVSSKNQCPF